MHCISWDRFISTEEEEVTSERNKILTDESVSGVFYGKENKFAFQSRSNSLSNSILFSRSKSIFYIYIYMAHLERSKIMHETDLNEIEFYCSTNYSDFKSNSFQFEHKKLVNF